jgi:hypothetical protein
VLACSHNLDGIVARKLYIVEWFSQNDWVNAVYIRLFPNDEN